MKKHLMCKFIVFLLISLVFISCSQMGDILDRVVNSGPLTASEVSFGLKEALTIGTRLAVDNLSAEDGFLLDETVRILLPPEVRKATNLINRIPGGKKLINDMILKLNRAAEFAITGAVPIFVEAITSLTIRDAFDILRGDDHAATQYLRGRTFDSLYKLFQPEIKKSLDKRLIGDLSTNRTWSLFTDKYNRVAGSIAGKIAGIKPANQNLDDYVTGRALEALFLKLSMEEKKIRENPLARTTTLLKRVFGST